MNDQNAQREPVQLRRRVAELEAECSALKETASQYKAILETTVDAIITIDSHGMVQSFNAAAERVFGYRAEEVIGNNVTMLMPEPHCSQHDGYIVRYLETGAPRIIGYGRKVNGLRKDGTEFPMDLAVGNVVLKDKRLFTGIVRDMTEQLLLEQQLIQASKEATLGHLVSGIAHEVNNPVSIIGVHLTNMMREVKNQPVSAAMIEAIATIQRQNNKIAHIISELLSFSRQSPFKPRLVDINETVRRAARLVKNALKDRAIVYRAKLKAGLPKLWVDPIGIEQVLINLFDNAIDAMPKGGILTVSTAHEPDASDRAWVVIRVEDTGEGIPEADLAHVFDPFFTTKDVGKGTGLGLAVSYGLIQKHEGRLEVSSQPGKGSAFRICLPIDDAVRQL